MTGSVADVIAMLVYFVFSPLQYPWRDTLDYGLGGPTAYIQSLWTPDVTN